MSFYIHDDESPWGPSRPGMYVNTDTKPMKYLVLPDDALVVEREHQSSGHWYSSTKITVQVNGLYREEWRHPYSPENPAPTRAVVVPTEVAAQVVALFTWLFRLATPKTFDRFQLLEVD